MDEVETLGGPAWDPIWRDVCGYMTANGWRIGLNLFLEVDFFQYGDAGVIVCDVDTAEAYWRERDKYPFGPPRF